MSPLAKILIVVQALLVMSYLGVSSTLYQHRNDWRRSFISLKGCYTKTAKRASEEISSLRNTLKERNEFINLKEVEIGDLSKELKRAEADFVKTSTGFSTGGATAGDVALMRRVVGDGLGVKASGGVRNQKDAVLMMESGANRIGASAGVKILHEIRGLSGGAKAATGASSGGGY